MAMDTWCQTEPPAQAEKNIQGRQLRAASLYVHSINDLSMQAILLLSQAEKNCVSAIKV